LLKIAALASFKKYLQKHTHVANVLLTQVIAKQPCGKRKRVFDMAHRLIIEGFSTKAEVLAQVDRLLAMVNSMDDDYIRDANL